MSPSVSIRLAHTSAEFESAFALLQKSREQWKLSAPGEPGEIWLLKHHALPTTNTIIAVEGQQIIGALCLFGESPYLLPMESHMDLGPFREDFEGRLAEITIPGLAPDYGENQELVAALFHFAHEFGAYHCQYNGLVLEAPPAWAAKFAATIGYENVYQPAPDRQVLFAKPVEGAPFTSPNLPLNFEFPEKRYFLIAHQSMSPKVLDYLFNKRTQVFASLSDFDLRVLKNIYDYGEYSSKLPDTKSPLPEKKVPRHPRFPMNCEGFMISDDGERLHVQLLDVSREGLKLRSPEGIDNKASYMLTLVVGVNRKTELIARTVWADQQSRIAGLEIKSGDDNWIQLIDYLEKDSMRAK